MQYLLKKKSTYKWTHPIKPMLFKGQLFKGLLQFLEVLLQTQHSSFRHGKLCSVRVFLRVRRTDLLHGADQCDNHPADFLDYVGKSFLSSRIAVSKSNWVRREPSSWDSLVCVFLHTWGAGLERAAY